MAYEDLLSKRKANKPCPYCRNEKTLKRDKQKRVQMYQCKSCAKWYSETTGDSALGYKIETEMARLSPMHGAHVTEIDCRGT
jgi:transposase-like protein